MTYKKNCEVCKSHYQTNCYNKKFCSDKCRKQHWIKKTGRSAMASGLPTGTVGAISELLVAGDLLKKGYGVFRSVSPSCYCDILAIKNGEISEVEVRTGYKSDTGKYSFAKGLRDTANMYAVWERNSGDIVYFDKDFIRIEP